MGIYCVSSVTTGGSADGSTWNNAFATVTLALANATVIADASPVFLVDSAHSVTANAAITWTMQANQKLAILSVNRNSNTTNQTYSGFLAGATESIGAASSAFIITGVDGTTLYCNGITINAGTNGATQCDIAIGNTSGVSCFYYFQGCTLALNGASTGAQFVIGASGVAGGRSVKVKWEACAINAPAARAGTMILLGQAELEIINMTCATNASTKPAIFIGIASLSSSKPLITIRDSDFSGFSASGGALIDVTNFLDGSALLKNLTLSASGTPTTIITGSWPALSTGYILAHNCGNSSTISNFEYRAPQGSVITELNAVASGGASFNSVSASWRIDTLAACTPAYYLALPQMTEWNTATSAKTFSLEFITDAAAVIKNDVIWGTFNYAASASFTNYAYDDTNRVATPFSTSTGSTSPIAQPTGSATWSGTVISGFSNGQSGKGKLVPLSSGSPTTVTPAAVGLVEANVFVGYNTSGSPIYLDPLLRIT